jgi:hypothetical protein
MLYAVESTDLTYNGSLIGYDLDSDAHDILSVVGEVDSTTDHWENMMDWRKLTNMPVSEFASGVGLMVRTALPHGANIRVTYSKPFTRLSAETEDLEADGGLADYMVDLPYYFAMSRLLVLEETERSQSSAAENHQRAQDVPGFLALRTGEWYLARYNDLKTTCYQRLRQAHRKTQGGSYGG